MGDRLAELKTKYQPVLRVIEQQRVQLKNVHIENDKLLIRGEAPSTEAKNKVWDQVKLVDPKYNDLTIDITVSPSALSDATTSANTYTVQSGDTLSGISKRFYGDAHQYMKIFEANKDQLKDPDKIQPGQKLVIPAQ
jgi:nucleoid-associated protein YgaU